MNAGVILHHPTHADAVAEFSHLANNNGAPSEHIWPVKERPVTQVPPISSEERAAAHEAMLQRAEALNHGHYGHGTSIPVWVPLILVALVAFVVVEVTQ
jgi:hypothetical protein